MSDPTDYPEEYVAARRILLDGLVALAPHGAAFIVAGAQAIYLRTGAMEIDEVVAPYTTDADLALQPEALDPAPEIAVAMSQAGFRLDVEPGIWLKTVSLSGADREIPVDLIVPEGAAPPGGRRGARLGPHGNRAARRAVGLEAVLRDNGPIQISALERSDPRTVEALVAGSAAMIVAKLHKLHDRAAGARDDRLKDKDASDLIRLMIASDTGEVVATLSELCADEMAGQVSRTAIEYLGELFGARGGPGILLAGRALRLGMSEDQIAVIAQAFTRDVLAGVAP